MSENAKRMSRTAHRADAPKFSLAHLTVLGCAPPEMTYLAAEAGYDFVSFRIIYMGSPNEPNYALAHNPEMMRRTKAALAETGVQVHDIEVARIVDDASVEAYAPALKAAGELGARYLITSVWSRQRDYALESIAELCDLAKPAGLGVSLEFLPWSAMPRLQDAVDMRHAVQRENCGLLIDVLHFQRARAGLDELDAVPAEYFHFAHVCDADAEIPAKNEAMLQTAREARLDPGCGGIEVAAILERMPDMTYSLEIPNLARVREVGYGEHARLCLENAKRYLGAGVRGAT